jgi:crossover junction endodeoxyribonuclease RuvC
MRDKNRILAIDPGTREMGVAVLESGKLLYSAVEIFRKLRSPQEQLRQGRAAVTRLIRDFRPTVLAVEKTFIGKNRNAALLNVLADEVCALGRRKGLAVARFAPNTVKKIVSGYGWATKEEVAQAVAAKFPELKAYLPPDRNWKRRRQLNMFDAVALGIACLSSRPTNLRARGFCLKPFGAGAYPPEIAP